MEGMILMDNKCRNSTTELNKYDKKILKEYTGFYSNMIESNTAKTDLLENQSHSQKS